MQRILPIALITILCADQSLAASFDCAKATTRTEKMICSNLEISRADEQLATAYKQAMGKATDKATLKQQQKEWLKSRDSISDSAKLLLSYNQRIAELESGKPANALVSGKINPVGTYSYREGGYSGTMVITQASDSPVTWKALITTVEKAPSAHTCDFTATGTQLISSATAVEAQFQSKVDDGDEPAKFAVTFTAQGAEVDLQSKGIECGMRGYFGGKYQKNMKGRK